MNVSPSPSLSAFKCRTPRPKEPTTAYKLSVNGAKSRAPFTSVYMGEFSFPDCIFHETISVSKMAHKRPLATTNFRNTPRTGSPETSRKSEFIRPMVAPSFPFNAKANPPGKPALAGSGSSALAAVRNLLSCKSCTRRATGTAGPNFVSTTLPVGFSPARNFSPSLARTTPPSPVMYKIVLAT